MPSEVEVLAMMRDALASPKTLLSTPEWRSGNRNGKLVIAVACECEVPGVTLHGCAQERRPDEDVSFTLSFDDVDETWPIARLDWRPPDYHINRVRGPHYGLQTWTGLHDFEANAGLGLIAMKAGNLPICLPVEPEPESYAGLLVTLQQRFRIINATSLQVPQWFPTLL